MRQVELVATMGTVVSIDVRTPSSRERFQDVTDAVTRRLRDIDAQFSAWRPRSWVSRLISGEVTPEDCPAEVQQVVERALDLMEITDGYFSPYWRRRAYGDPGPDPTGLVKGWAAQQASDVLVAHGLPDHVVNAAGDVVASGQSAPGDAASTWHVGISDPHRTRELAGVVHLDQSSRRWAVATSGTAELGTHVSDPHTGRFPFSVVSATAVTSLDTVEDGGAVADACATALVAAGSAAPALVPRIEAAGVDVFLIEGDGSVRDPQHLLATT